MAMVTSSTAPRPLRTFLLAGLGTGVVAVMLAVLAAQLIQRGTGQRYAELSAFSIAFAALFTNVLGGGAYALLVRRTARPVLYYAILALTLATLDTIMVTANPPHDGFATLATPLHYIVAVTSIILVPRLAVGRRAAHR